MSYVALYRKFRPDNFIDVKGQDHIVTTLKNQIEADRIGHAYLFCGTRGTGKTSIAKLFAKAVNCQNPKDGSPCGECESCKRIAAGVSMDVVEMDAASNNGVEDVRNIIDAVSYPPSEGKYRVYIIDEVHMLSTNAFNALLKTLEEPPSYCIFILATTEVHKIPITILSRCQRYDFKRISIDTIADRLEELMQKENVDVEPKALRYIAKTADGSMRDALSLLDQCIAFHYGKKLTYEDALDVLGAIDTEVFSKLLRSILDRDVTGCIKQLEEIVSQGREMTWFISDFTWYLRNLLIVKTGPDAEEMVDMSADNLNRLREEAQMCESETILRFIRVFSELSGEVRYASQKRILIEVALIKLCRPQMETDKESVIDRVRVLEDKMENGEFTVNAVRSVSEQTAVESEPAKLPEALPEDVQRAVNEWRQIMSDFEGLERNLITKMRVSLSAQNKLLLVYPANDAPMGIFDKEVTQEHVKRIISDHIGKEIEVEFQKTGNSDEMKSVYPDILKMAGINTTIIEED
ncbi:MAG: DNA polymerase III subunit gamma/tau [Lachnospiraceae bacterium]|nr:DNA polymerase III subunit gamma/tau [Lachnospiraceae bacterium]